MMKRILLYSAKLIFKIILLLILIAFLAKSDNMPAAVPQRYVDKIVEITDRILISLHLITDKNIIAKYKEEKKEGNISYLKKSEGNSLLFYVYDAIFYNLYNFNHYEKLKIFAYQMEKRLNDEMSKITLIANSEYLKSFFEKLKLNIIDKYSLELLKISLKNFSYFTEVIISSDKYNYNIKYKNIKFNIAKLKNNFFWYNERFYYIVNSNNEDYKLKIIIDLITFFKQYNYIVNDKIFIADKDFKIIYSKINNNILNKIEANYEKKKFSFHNKKFIINYIYLPEYKIYIGNIYQSYPFYKLVLNILRLLFVIGIIVLLYLYGKILLNKIREFLKIKKEDEILILSETMAEVSKSIKLATEATERIIKEYNTNDKNIHNREIEKYIKEIIELKDSRNESKEKKEKSKGNNEEWKIIEPF